MGRCDLTEIAEDQPAGTKTHRGASIQDGT